MIQTNFDMPRMQPNCESKSFIEVHLITLTVIFSFLDEIMTCLDS